MLNVSDARAVLAEARGCDHARGALMLLKRLPRMGVSPNTGACVAVVTVTPLLTDPMGPSIEAAWPLNAKLLVVLPA